MRLAVRHPNYGWVELVGFDRLSPVRQAKELWAIREIRLEFTLALEGEPFFPKTAAES